MDFYTDDVHQIQMLQPESSSTLWFPLEQRRLHVNTKINRMFMIRKAIKINGIIEKVKDFMDSELPEGPNKTMKWLS